MKPGFEDKFMDVQSGLIALCLEGLDAAHAEADKVYAYAFVTQSTAMFNTFFEQGGRILPANKVITAQGLLMRLLQLGTQDVSGLPALCQAYETECPLDMKMYYDCRTKQYHADYRYASNVPDVENISPYNTFMEWRKAVAAEKGQG